MAGCGFFHGAGVEDLGGLITLAYDLAYFWKVDPDQMLARPLDVLLEALAHAQRIHSTQQAGAG